MNPYKSGDVITLDGNNASARQVELIIKMCGNPPYVIKSINHEWCRIRKIDGNVDGWHYSIFKLYSEPVKITLEEDLFII